MEEQRSLVRQWEGRVAETETMYRGKLSTLENDHRAAIESMRKVTVTFMTDEIPRPLLVVMSLQSKLIRSDITSVP